MWTCAASDPPAACTLQHRRCDSIVLEMTSRRKRGPCQVHGIEQELRFKRLAKMCGLTKSVLLVLEYKETGRDVSALKRGVHALGLIDWHDRIVLTVKKYHWGGEPVGEIDRRTVVVKCAVRPIRLDKPVDSPSPFGSSQLRRYSPERQKQLPPLPRGADRKKSPPKFSRKWEYFRYGPETFGIFSL